MFALIAQAVNFGFLAGVLPGPFQSYIINTTLYYGWRRSIVIIFSPLIIDIPFIITVLFLFFGVSLIAQGVGLIG